MWLCFNQYPEFHKLSLPIQCEVFDTLGSKGQELVDVYTEMETVHPNFGNDKYVSGLQPNMRTSNVIYVFKRPRIDGVEDDNSSNRLYYGSQGLMFPVDSL